MPENNSYNSMEVTFYQGDQPMMLTGQLSHFKHGGYEWEFHMHDKDAQETVLRSCSYNELISLILLGLARRDELKAEAAVVDTGLEQPLMT